MQNTTIQRLKLTNFKGIREFECRFSNRNTDIFGRNGSGKTTLVDAFLWLLFGKDSRDRKDFDIKTLDDKNQVIPEIDHEVEADIRIGEQVVTLRKTLRENWVKRRGSTTRELAGNDTLYYWNDVPMKAGEYQAKVSGLIDESLFKLITNPLYFNQIMKWQDRRAVLFGMADSVSEEQVFGQITSKDNAEAVNAVRKVLSAGKTFDEYRKEIASKKKKLRDELDSIPTRIDEANRSMPVDADWSAIEREIVRLQGEIAELNASKEDMVKAQAKQNDHILAEQRRLNDLKQQLQAMEFDLTKDLTSKARELAAQIQDTEFAIRSQKAEIADAQKRINNANEDIARLERESAALREEWAKVNSRELVIPEDKTICPSCRRRLEDDDIQTTTDDLTARFNQQKAADLDRINQSGMSNKQRIKDLHDAIGSLQVGIQNSTGVLEGLQAKQAEQQKAHAEALNVQPVWTDEMKSLKVKIDSFEMPVGEGIDFSGVNSKLAEMQSALDQRKADLSHRDQITRIRTRIAELQNQQEVMAQELADLEQSEFVLEAYNKAKVDTMVQSVNQKFKHIRFKLFEEQINGGLSECCEALVNTNGAWVPFSSANQAGQVNAGIDTINTLCTFHNVTAPIFIDNRESVTELIPTESQVINLVVSPAHSQLTIN